MPINPLLIPRLEEPVSDDDRYISEHIINLLSEPANNTDMFVREEPNPYVRECKHKVLYKYLGAECVNNHPRDLCVKLKLTLYSADSDNSILLDQTNIISMTIHRSTIMAECLRVITDADYTSTTQLNHFICKKKIDIYKPNFPEIDDMLNLIPQSLVRNYFWRRHRMWIEDSWILLHELHRHQSCLEGIEGHANGGSHP